MDAITLNEQDVQEAIELLREIVVTQSDSIIAAVKASDVLDKAGDWLAARNLVDEVTENNG